MWSSSSLVKAVALLGLSSLACAKKCSNSTSTDWVTIWGTMPQLTEPANLPPAPFVRLIFFLYGLDTVNC